MKQYRVTKYDPRNRNADGAYLLDEWMGFDDIGREFNGVVLTGVEYRRLEDAYVSTAVQMLEASRVQSVALSDVESHSGFGRMGLIISNGHRIPLQELAPYMRAILRGHFWGRLEGDGSFVHFGWDFYMYVGTPVACPQSVADRAREAGIFIEPFVSPYHREE